MSDRTGGRAAHRSRLVHRLRRARRTLAFDAEGAVREVQERLERQHGRIAALERDLARIGPQVAALEARIEDLRAPTRVPSADAGELADATSLVAEIRREHERMRARISAASRFEERLGQVEDLVAALHPTTS